MHRQIIEDLSKDCPCEDRSKWCFLRELIPYITIDDRMAEQLRLMYDYKFMQSQKEGIDIGKERAFKEFVDLYAKRFAEIYQEGMKHDELFEKIFGFKLTHTDDEVRNHIRGNV